jgi:cell division protein ZapE
MSTIRELYASHIAAGAVERDPAQLALVDRLDALNARLATHRLARKSSSLGWLFGSRESTEEPLKGCYIYGEVGRGKTMLMDMFFAACPAKRKHRAHFHEFMADVHERIHGIRQKIKSGEIADQDQIAVVAAEIAEDAWVLCFDEFHVTDIADAMILGRLFTRLFDLGVIMVATSNVAPDDLYKDGLNRALFTPFIALLKERVDIVRLEARTDFRLEKLAGMAIWHMPIDEESDVALDIAWQSLTGTLEGDAMRIEMKGRFIQVPQAAKGAARFTFAALCDVPLGASDYLRLAREFHTLIIDHIPVMSYERRNEAKRFIALIDTLYDHAVKLIASAAAEPTALYVGDAGYEAQEFKRTASRLIEMGSATYLALPHGKNPSAGSGSTEGLVET